MPASEIDGEPSRSEWSCEAELYVFWLKEFENERKACDIGVMVSIEGDRGGFGLPLDRALSSARPAPSLPDMLNACARCRSCLRVGDIGKRAGTGGEGKR